ncbi:TIGR03790 family protein [Piscinibacter sp. XHJ-5]|uniref:TIGR03790 family protein n=1 Tax=Piscinibacter sp. XHJ-5 TaxID=3037797 RepID=UPI002452D210|nr:TIGR03790 family protein [Piscinibacter sp. XHJ-5]
MAKRKTAFWDGFLFAIFVAAVVAFVPDPAFAQMAPRTSGWVVVPKSQGRLTAQDLGLVINVNDPYSVEVGEFYAHARKLLPEQVLRIEVPVKPTLTPEEFDALKSAVESHFGPDIQALALAWTQPFAVNCNSITGALSLGYDAELCNHSCAPSRPSPYFNAPTARPFSELKLRPSMLIAANDAASAKSLIERGVRADHSLGLRGAPPVHAYFVATKDRVRSARAPLFPPAGPVRAFGIDVHVESTQFIENAQRLLLYQTGAAKVEKLDTLHWVPGALADHLTSFGGRLDRRTGQMTALEWIASGATASYGTVSEPCSHPQKFPHPQLLLSHYAQGSTAIEAYWKSVAWPQQGVFIGEPLAAPFSKR